MGSIPLIYEYKEKFEIQKSIQEELRIKFQKKEKLCKAEHSDYKKFLSLGFPKTATKKFNNCMQEK